jgi:hypothetical protein
MVVVRLEIPSSSTAGEKGAQSWLEMVQEQIQHLLPNTVPEDWLASVITALVSNREKVNPRECS